MLTVSVENFGPIREGTVELRPLTVFVGPNNSGKSYMATLIYAISCTLAADFVWNTRWIRRPALRHYSTAPLFGISDLDIPDRAQAALKPAEAREQIRAWITGCLAQDRKSSVRPEALEIGYTDLPPPLRQALQITVEEYLDTLAWQLIGEIERCFGDKVSNLSSNFTLGKSSTISIGSTQPRFELRLELSDRNVATAAKSVSLTSARFPLYYFDVDTDDSWPSWPLLEFLSESAGQIMRQMISRTYYLPASRSGILQSYKSLASLFMRRSPLAGVDDLGLPRLTGVVADFVSNTLSLDVNQKTDGKIRNIAGFLQSKIIRGSVSLKGSSKIVYPEIQYTRDGKDFELHRTSSMVSELVPIVLFIRHLTRPDDLLIVEEPESHLHPAAQRPLARAFARLLGQGVNLLLTTHSDYFIQQLSHLMQLGALSPEQRVRLGYADEDVIPVSAVGPYLFDTSGPEPGCVVRELPVEDSDGVPGIPDDQYADVSEALYNEMVNLERAAARNESRTE